MPESLERLLSIQLLGVSAFNMADYFLTLQALERGYIEANPILRPMIGTYEFPLVKLLLVPLVLLFIWHMRFRVGEIVVKLAWIPFTCYLLLMVYFSTIIK